MLQEVVFVVLMIVHATKEHIDCGMYTAANGTSCFLCPPGYYKIRDCDENGMPAHCMPCPNGKFQMTCNQATTCAPCASHCRWFNSDIKENCTATSDLVCECEPGYFLINQGDGNGICKRHKQCPPGQGVSRPGTAIVDVQCEPCVNGSTYSNLSSSTQLCQKCSTCFTTVTSPCTSYKDTNCSSAPATITDGLSQTSTPVIIAVCVLAVAVAVLGGGLLIYILNKRRRRRNQEQENEAGQLPELNDVHGGDRESTPGPPIQNVNNEELTSSDLQVDTNPIDLADVLQSKDHLRAQKSQKVPHNQDTSNGTRDNIDNTYATLLFADPINSGHPSSPSNDVNDIDNTDPKQIIPNDPGNVLQNVTQQPDRGGNSNFVITDRDSSRARQDEAVVSVFMILAEKFVMGFEFFLRRLGHFSGKIRVKGPPVESWIEQSKAEGSNKGINESHYILLEKWRQWYGKLDDNFFLIIKKALEDSNANEILDQLETETEFKEYIPSS